MPLSHTAHGSGPPLIIAHGLFGSSRNWTGLAKRLSATHRVVAVDLRNHGASFWHDSMTYGDMAEDLRAFIAGNGLDGAAVLGHSMGGKAAMMLALAHPNLVGRLIVVDIAPVTYGPRFDDLIAALRALPLDTVRRRGEADALLADAIPDPALRGFLLQNLEFDPAGTRWRINLAVIAATMRDIRGFPELLGHRSYGGPALFIAGAASDYVRPGHHALIRGLFPAARFATIDGAGHWVHAEQPQSFLETVSAFI